ncbi:MAG: LysR family transcriptional regulator [Gammaproteobacteria bacterium]|nr:LysR family transcriptional regulator [Gammaproteobacteria bacterium]
MYLEIRHLHTLTVIRDSGNLARAAERLHLTQSALSHQIKALEEQFGCTLFMRKSRPLRFTPAGMRLLELADQVVPAVQATERELTRFAEGQTGRLHIAIECHSCFEWLMPTIDAYRNHWPEVEMDLSTGFSFDPLPALARGDIDLAITSDLQPVNGIHFAPLFRYQALLAMANDHPLAAREWITPRDLAGETLITYPVDRSRLDVFRHFLDPAGIEPAGRRTAELTLIILQLVASRRGVAALPNWVLADYLAHGYVTARPLGKEGSWNTLYCALRSDDRGKPYLRDFIDTAKATSFRNLSGIESCG